MTDYIVLEGGEQLDLTDHQAIALLRAGVIYDPSDADGPTEGIFACASDYTLDEVEKLKDYGLFTPRLSRNSDDRQMMLVDPADSRDFHRHRGPGAATVLADKVTGKSYLVESAPCSADCYCDAVIVAEVAA